MTPKPDFDNAIVALEIQLKSIDTKLAEQKKSLDKITATLDTILSWVQMQG